MRSCVRLRRQTMDCINRKTSFSFIFFVSCGLILFIISNTSKYTVYYSPNYVQILHKHNETDVKKAIGKHSSLSQIPEKAYLVETSNCRIVQWPPFDDQTRPLYVDQSNVRIGCGFGKSRQISIERFNYTAIQVINNSDKKVECFESEVIRNKGTDNGIRYSKSAPFDHSLVRYFPENTSVIKVSCLIDDGHKSYEKVIPLIPEMKVNGQEVADDMPNLLFIGIDSVSRLNFDRHFPLTKKQLSKHEFYTMYGYNKVADNTFVNLTPLLTGFYLDDIWNETISKNKFLDYFPFVWKDYKRKGYKTLFMEDAPDIATFNYLKKGFLEAPTDYYLRPYSLAIEKDVKSDCYLDKTELDTYYEYVYDFVKAMKERQQKYFAFTWMARLSHNNLNRAGLVDPIVNELFGKLFDENMLSNTILLFFSDHGIRFGPIRETLSGKIEERMPFMHIYVPKKWRNRNLTVNENRLTTPFDIHATLKHIVDGKPDYGLRYGKSLLEEIPENRSCDSIPLLEHWCSCQSSEVIQDLSSLEPISKFIAQSVNQLIAKENFAQKCSELTLERTVSAFEQHLSEKILKFKDSRNDVIDRHVIYGNKAEEAIKHFLVTIEVKPSKALLEATVNVNQKTKKMQIIGEISRINFYGNQSNCIDNQFVRRYCYCLNDTNTS